ncbi:MAG TPA: hypothetical protein PLT76_04885 [Candidatus Omnitrophota bacterium]|nr:hypothetical protein [Candidatus Omnitrophota bacterium]HQO58036.1 hypothetical protein [Candidatus Omnitrophota bacterium]
MITRLKNIQTFSPATAFLMAFCPLCYMLLIASRLSRIFGEDLFVFPTVTALFILFLGLGNTFRRTRAPGPEPGEKALPKIMWIELGLTFLGFFSVLGIDAFLFDSLSVINLEAGVLGLGLTAGIGFLSGHAFALFYHSGSPRLEKNQDRILDKISVLLAAGSASLLYAAVFSPALGDIKTAILISFINFLLTLQLFLARKERPVGRLWLSAGAVLSGFFIAVSLYSDQIEDKILQRAYLGRQPAQLIAKDQTSSQRILLYLARKDGWPIVETQKEILAKPSQYFILGMTNGFMQFSLPFESQMDPEHVFLLDPYITLLPYIKNILILGGGDGLAVRQAVQYKSISNITVVESGPAWVTAVKNTPYLQKLTRHAFEDPRVKIHFMDPLKWVLRDSRPYDLIIVNAPPGGTRNLIEIKTLSVQFLRDLKRLVSKHGVIIITSSGTVSSPSKISVQARTAREAGLTALVGTYGGKKGAWGKTEQLVLFHSEKTLASFLDSYKRDYLPRLKYGWKNLAKFGIITYSLPRPAGQHLSVYDPFISKLPFKTKLKLITEDYASP